ncbi:MAG: OmpA family protein, partial [Rikenellaceae bacterium]
VNRTEIRPDFGNNPAELTKIREMIEDIKNDAAITIKHITITGYASPEGSLANNQRLSEGRAKALEGYLQSRYNLSKDLYTINFGGEDWEGLVELVEASDMLYKQEVLDIILNTSIENNREKKLMNLKVGVPYRYMLHDMFPKLRRVICKIDYNVKTFDVNEAKELVKTKPQNLSLNEMYQVAVTYEKGSDEFNNVFYVAVKMFPNDQTANLNAAATALSRGDIVSAEEYLNNVNSRVRIAQYDNLIGVILMIKGNYDRAEQYFKSAEQTGLYEATKNLEEIAKKHANELEYRNSKHK